MPSTHDFVVDGVITTNPDTARAELAREESNDRKVLKVFDLQNICQAADGIGDLFAADGEFTDAIAEHCTCSEVDKFVALLQSLDHYDDAATLLSRHIDADGCAPKHPTAAA